MKIAGVILSGGQSSRMGTDKSQLKLGDKTLLEHTEQLLIDSKIQDTYISGKNGIKDIYTSKGPISGIQASLNYLKQFEFVIFTPVDMPFITKEVIFELIEAINIHQAQVVYFSKNNLPLIIQNNKKVRLLVKNQIDMNELSIFKLLTKLNSRSINNQYSQDVFINTNSPNQWERAKHKLLKL